jgi:Zeta toxin
MIWTPARNKDQGLLVTGMYERADGVPCERDAVIAGGLRGTDKASALAQAAVNQSHYLTISIDLVMEEMAARDLIPRIEGLSPLEGANLVHAEAQFLAKRLGLRAMADGRNLLWDITMASGLAVESWLSALNRARYATTGVFVDIDIETSVRRSEAIYRSQYMEHRRGRGYGGRYVPPEAIRALTSTSADSGAPQGDWISAAELSRSPAGGPVGARFPYGEVTGLIASYLAREITLDGLASGFRARRWPEVPSACPLGMEAAAAAIDDPEPYVPGSFDDVVAAYDLGRLSDAEYAVLATAAASSLGRRGSDDRPAAPDDPPP